MAAGDQVVPHHQVVAVHEKATDAVAAEIVAFHHCPVGVHEVESVAAIGDPVVPQDQIVGEPDHRVPAAIDDVAFDDGPRALPEPDPVAAPAQL